MLRSLPARRDVAEEAERLAHALPRVLEPPADDPLERMQPELHPRHDAEVATPATEAPEQLGVLFAVGANHSPAGVTSSAAIRLSQVSPNWAVRWPIPPPRVRPATPVEPTTPPGVTRPWAWVAASKSSQVAPPS